MAIEHDCNNTFNNTQAQQLHNTTGIKVGILIITQLQAFFCKINSSPPIPVCLLEGNSFLVLFIKTFSNVLLT